MKAKKVKKLDCAAPLDESAARIIATRLGELRGFAPKALKPRNVSHQHDMRIAAKRLRYVLEVTEFCFGEAAIEARKRTRELQEILGELHDCDVMAPRVETHLAELRAADAAAVRAKAGQADDLEAALVRGAPNRTAYRGLEMLLVYLQARRELLHDRFRSFWAEQGPAFDALGRTVEDRIAARR